MNFSRFLPDMFARWDLKSENITYNFNVRNGFNDINSLVEGFILPTVLQEVTTKTQVTSHRLNYSKYNLYNFTILEIFRTQPKRSSVNGISFQSIYSTSDRLNLDAEMKT
jgi:hypothetical protein